MKKRMTIVIAIMHFMFFSCKNICNTDTKFEEKFNKSITIIHASQFQKAELLVEDIQNAVFFVVAVSKIEPCNFDIENVTYCRREDCVNDIKLWNDWYKEHKCNFSIEIADSLFSEHAYGKNR